MSKTPSDGTKTPETDHGIEKPRPDGDNRAQVPVLSEKTCELCEGYNANWKCIECNQKICDRCKKIHVRQTATKKHRIVEVKDVVSSPVCTGYCQVHEGQSYSLYCRSCHKLICNKCITTKHCGHEFCQIEEVEGEKRSKLQDTIERQRDILSSENIERERFNKEKKRALKRYDSAGSAIKEHIRKLTEHLNGMESELVESIEKRKDELKREIKLCDVKHDLRKNDLCRMIDEGETILKNGTGIQIVQFEATVEDNLNSLPPEVESIDMVFPSFEPLFQNLSTMKPEDLLGRLVYDRKGKKKPTLERNESRQSIQSQDSFTMGTTTVKYVAQLRSLQDRNVGCIAPVADNEAWVACPYDENVYLVRSNGNITKEISTEFNVSDIALTLSGDLLVASAERKCLKIIKDESIFDFIDTFPSEPHGVSVTRKGEILICKTNGKFGQVVRLADNGKSKREYDTYIVNKQTFLLRKPIRCIETPNEDIWILDEAIRKIIVLDGNGNYKFTWEGPLKSSRRNFDPSGLDFDEDGNVLVTDYDANKIYVISPNGCSTETLEYEDPRDREQMSDPFGIAIHANKYLWVGCDDGMMYVMKYRMADQK